jgi:hypothetical protein
MKHAAIAVMLFAAFPLAATAQKKQPPTHWI